jgi:hypothetical protein
LKTYPLASAGLEGLEVRQFEGLLKRQNAGADLSLKESLSRLLGLEGKGLESPRDYIAL